MDRYTDIVVRNTIDGKEYKLHKFILGQISYFDKMFKGGYLEEDMEEIEVEFDPESWEKIIRYIYIPYVKNYGKFDNFIECNSFSRALYSKIGTCYKLMENYDNREMCENILQWNYEDYGLADMLGMEKLANRINDTVLYYLNSICFEYYNIKERHKEREKCFRDVLTRTENLANKSFLARKMISENWTFKKFTNVLGSFLLDFFINNNNNIDEYKYTIITICFLNKNFIPLCGNILESLENLTDGEKYLLGLIPYDFVKIIDDNKEYDTKLSDYQSVQEAINLDKEGAKSVKLYFKQQQKLDYPNRDFLAYFLVKYHFPGKLDIFPISHLVNLNLLYLLPVLIIRYRNFIYPKYNFHHLLISSILEQCSSCPPHSCSSSICSNYIHNTSSSDLFQDKEYCIKLIIINLDNNSKLPFHKYLSKLIVLGDKYHYLVTLFYKILLIQNNSSFDLLHTYEKLLSSHFDLTSGKSLHFTCPHFNSISKPISTYCICKCSSHTIHFILDLLRKRQYPNHSLSDFLH